MSVVHGDTVRGDRLWLILQSPWFNDKYGMDSVGRKAARGNNTGFLSGDYCDRIDINVKIVDTLTAAASSVVFLASLCLRSVSRRTPSFTLLDSRIRPWEGQPLLRSKRLERVDV